jgi:hypothetical protein
VTGLADEALYAALGLTFPEEFERCLTVTCGFEGTRYGDCNHKDIDNAGLTFGIVGFTSEHGEAQNILKQFRAVDPAMLDVFGAPRAAELETLLNGTADPEPWGRFFYGTAFRRHASKGLSVLADVPAAFAAWGTRPTMRRIQQEEARKMWDRALKSARQFSFVSMSARGFFFDVVVQNGGFRQEHADSFLAMNLDAQPESVRLEGAAQAVGSHANPEYGADVLSRKLVFARRSGTVHGVNYNLDAQAFF